MYHQSGDKSNNPMQDVLIIIIFMIYNDKSVDLVQLKQLYLQIFFSQLSTIKLERETTKHNSCN